MVHVAPFQDLIASQGRPMCIEAGEHVFRQGDACSGMFQVRDGLLKAYYMRADGKEHIKSFQPEGSIITRMVAIIEGAPSTFSLAAIEASELVALPYSALEDAASRDLALSSALIEFLSTYWRRKERREFELFCLSPEDRYTLLVEDAPSLIDRISQADLAAFIGVTPQALSRIKRKMRE